MTATVDIGRYRPHIERALGYAGDTHRFTDVAEMVAAGHALLWPGPASCIVTESISYPQKRVLNFFVAGGNLPELTAMAPLILQWAKEKGFQRAVLCGRPGWERALAPMGFERRPLVILEKDL